MTLVPSPTTGALTTTSLGVVTETYTPNEYGEPASYNAKVGALPFSITYDDGSATQSRDGFGRIYHQVENTAFGTTTTDYRYDEQARLSQVSVNGTVSRQYRYDYNGNRTSVDGGATTIAYDAQDRMSTYNGASYIYGANGERRKRTNPDGSADEYQYDALGNLSHITRADGVTIDYVVDALNRRILKKKNGAIYARYIYRNGLSPVAVLDSTGALAARFVYVTRPNTPDFMVLANGTVFKFLNDERGTPRAIGNAATGAVAQYVTYDEFGTPTVVLNSSAFPPWVQPFGFAGGLYDEDTKLVRFGARDYEAQTGRWLAKDPALFGGGQTNLYVYAGNDPINRVDRDGRNPYLVAGVLGGVAGGLYYAMGTTGSESWGTFGENYAAAFAGGAVAGLGVAAGGELIEAGVPMGYAGATVAGTGALGDFVGQWASGRQIDPYELIAAGVANAASLGIGAALAEPLTPYARSILARGGVKALIDKAVTAGEIRSAIGGFVFSFPLAWGVEGANTKPKPCP
jgi:RHS repeat-associated protein